MTLAFPYQLGTFANTLRIRSVSWMPLYQEEFSGIGTGEMLSAKLGPDLWVADVALADMYNAEAQQVSALIEGLGGSMQSFYLYNPLIPFPQYDPTGSILGASTPTILAINADNKRMSITGLPAGYRLTRGDMLGIDYGSPTRRALLRILEASITANGSGITGLFEIRPFFRPGIVAGLAVDLSHPAAKVKIVPGSLSIGPGQDISTTSIGFKVRQTLAAG